MLQDPGFLTNLWRDILSIGGFALTIAGGVIGVLAFVQARSAAKEAGAASSAIQEVRREVAVELSRRTLVEELGNLRHLLEPIVLLIEVRESGAARQLLRSSRDLLSLVSARWNHELDLRQTTRLDKSGTHLATASTWLVADLDDEKRILCQNAVESAIRLVIEVQGLAQATSTRLFVEGER